MGWQASWRSIPGLHLLTSKPGSYSTIPPRHVSHPLFRDSVTRAWRHWKMKYERGWETMPFARAIREGRRRLSHDDIKMPGHHRLFSYVKGGFYGDQMECAYRLFPREQILPLLTQALNDDPRQVLGQVYRFLGVEDTSARQLPRQLNPAKSFDYGRTIDVEDVRYTRVVYQKNAHLFGSLIGLDASTWTGGTSSAISWPNCICDH